jgi:hypothetical protein
VPPIAAFIAGIAVPNGRKWPEMPRIRKCDQVKKIAPSDGA